MSNAAKFTGANGTSYLVKSLNWKTLKDQRDNLVLIFERNKSPMSEGLPLYLDEGYAQAVMSLAAVSIMRADNKTLEDGELESAIDLSNWVGLVRVMLGANGFVENSGAASGEAQA